MKFAFHFIFLLSYISMQGQLGFCTGSKGDPIFHENFGTGSGTGSALAGGVTDYKFVTGDPNDGEYTISDNIGRYNTTWHYNFPAQTLSNGRALIVNADFQSGRFYRTKISGLCENTTYEFSAYLMNVYDRNANVCPNGGIPVNVRFEIWDETDTVLLKKGNTGNIPSTTSPSWKQHALTFQSQPGQQSVILKMFNNGDGGCGNDLAIDDIIFRSCGDLTTINSSRGADGKYEICEENAPVQIDLSANPDNSVYNQHFFQWQQSANGIDWIDISGANSASFSSPQLNVSTYYRVKVAEDMVNLSNNLCSSASDPFFVHIVQAPKAAISLGDIVICANENIPALEVLVEEDESVNWYSSATGGSPIAENTNAFIPERSGTYYAEAIKTGFECPPASRTAISLSINEIPQVYDEQLQLCPDSNLLLDAEISGMDYSWNTGADTQAITISSPGDYSVILENSSGCKATKLFEVIDVPDAEIAEIVSESEMVTIIPANEGDFLYSIDGINFQASNSFNPVSGGIYTAYIKDRSSCKLVTQQFPHLVIPKFITPNNDGYNDFFKLKGVEYFENSEIFIFDRYGKFLTGGKGAGFSWDGKFEGETLPADDYWYLIQIEDFPDKKGNFSLIR